MEGPYEPILVDRFPDSAQVAWTRLIRDVVGGGSATTPLIDALDGPVDALLEGIDVDAAFGTPFVSGSVDIGPDVSVDAVVVLGEAAAAERGA